MPKLQSQNKQTKSNRQCSVVWQCLQLIQFRDQVSAVLCVLSGGTAAHGPQGWLESRLDDRWLQVLERKPSPVDLPQASLELFQYRVVHSVGLPLVVG